MSILGLIFFIFVSIVCYIKGRVDGYLSGWRNSWEFTKGHLSELDQEELLKTINEFLKTKKEKDKYVYSERSE